MTVTNQSQETDSLRVSENDDGSFQVEWDVNDPMWMFLNEMTPEQVNEWFNEALERGLERYEQNPYSSTIPVEEDPITGEFYITIPPEIVKVLGLKEGDKITWIDNCDGSFTFKKSEEKINGTV